MVDEIPDNPTARPVTIPEMERLFSAQKTEVVQLFSIQKAEMEQRFATKVDMEQLLADQADIILEAVDERLDKKLNEKFDPVISKLDNILGSIETLKQENIVGAEQLHRHDDQLLDHERRIKTLELNPIQT